MGPALEDLRGPVEPEEYIAEQLKASSSEKRVLILRTSHVGGHKYAGNCIVSVPDVREQLLDAEMISQIYTPQGSGVWYGRVSPHEVDSIVINTIIHGLVLPPLLRGGLNISRPKCKTLNDW
jgi:Sucrase/ferredoxin-like